MTGTNIRSKYLEFCKENGHAIIPSSSLIPENDPTTLFTGSGMQPMVPYLLGTPHPLGNRITDSQTCFRAEDIEEVGDNRHTTFFEMLGNWSLGSYWKPDQLQWFFSFLTKIVGLDPKRLYVTVFSGDVDNHIPQDDEAVGIWQKLYAQVGIKAEAVFFGSKDVGAQKGMQDGRIFYYEDNWWSRAGAPKNMPSGEPGGPDSEVFYEFTEVEHDPSFGPQCHPNCDCGRFLEIGNSVFMTYKKQPDSSFAELPQKNIDFGGGLERITAAANNNPDIFTTDLFAGIITAIEEASSKSYQNTQNQPAMRIIADHMKAAVFLISQSVLPSNKMQGYFLRRLLRRSMVKLQQLKGDITSPVGDNHYNHICDAVIDTYKDVYLGDVDHVAIQAAVSDERDRFGKTLSKGLRVIQNTADADINGKFAFDLYQSYGFPLEITEELVKEKGIIIDHDVFRAEFKKHQDLSRTASAGMFKGGLADHSEATTKYHTATHLLHKALREVLGDHVQQMGSNITAERLRFDFKHPDKLTPEQLKAVEDLVNQKIKEDLPVHHTTEDKDKALKDGAMAFFREKYPDKVSVYTIGADPKHDWWSKELCGGPHVSSTGQIGTVTIKKEESVGAGIRRIYMMFRQ